MLLRKAQKSQQIYRQLSIRKVMVEFYIYPESFAPRPNIHFSDNISTAEIISRHTSRLKGFIY